MLFKKVPPAINSYSHAVIAFEDSITKASVVLLLPFYKLFLIKNSKLI